MGKLNEFLAGNTTVSADEEVPGVYGCSSCLNDVTIAYHSKEEGKLYWICPEGHRTEVSVV